MDPRKAAIVTNTINGNKKLFLRSLSDLFSFKIISHAFSGVKIILKRLCKKNL
jgi:hypothetical protein